MARKVLVVDDEKLIVWYPLQPEQDGMEVTVPMTGKKRLRWPERRSMTLCFDVMLPKLSGFEVCQQIREFSSMLIIMLTAKGDDMDKILGLEYGADDYITSPSISLR